MYYFNLDTLILTGELWHCIKIFDSEKCSENKRFDSNIFWIQNYRIERLAGVKVLWLVWPNHIWIWDSQGSLIQVFPLLFLNSPIRVSFPRMSGLLIIILEMLTAHSLIWLYERISWISWHFQISSTRYHKVLL